MFPVRGQAALEFLTTYGWAFAVILLMIGAISYFGISDPSSLVPDRCSLPPEILCEDFQITYSPIDDVYGGLVISLRQTVGRTLYISDIQCKDVDGAAFESGYVFDPTLGDDFSEHTDSGDLITAQTNPATLEWTPRENFIAKCAFTSGSIASRDGEPTKIPVRITYTLKDPVTFPNAFPHVAEGEVTATVVKWS